MNALQNWKKNMQRLAVVFPEYLDHNHLIFQVFDKYRRSLADFENLRNRMNKQVSDAKIFGIQGFCKVCGTSFVYLGPFFTTANSPGPARGGRCIEQGSDCSAFRGFTRESVPEGHAPRTPAH